ncbi:MAG: hypothetical protein M3Z04_08770 [Chloroflexota bacterium]|nr:hypothetical protein [Chloroflexota bacterium]
MAEAFVCPNCGAPQTVDGTQLTVVCPFCDTGVIVPPELRPARQVVATFVLRDLAGPPTVARPLPQAAPRRRTRPWGCLVIVLALVGVAIYGGQPGGIWVPLSTVFPQLTPIAFPTRTPYRFPTATARPRALPPPPTPPIVRPSPTPTALPPLGFSQTATFAGWVLSLARMESRTRLVYTKAGDYYSTKGRFWLIWADARNTQNSTHSLDGDLQWQLRDDQGAVYVDLEQDAVKGADTAVQLLGREALATAVLPRTLVHPLLLFQVAADAQPTELVITATDSDAVLRFLLPRK